MFFTNVMKYHQKMKDLIIFLKQNVYLEAVLPRKCVTQLHTMEYFPICPEQLTAIVFTEKVFHHVLLHGTFTF